MTEEKRFKTLGLRLKGSMIEMFDLADGEIIAVYRLKDEAAAKERFDLQCRLLELGAKK